MIKIEEGKNNWYIFVIIGLLIGAVLGYYASEKDLLKQKVVGRITVEECYRVAKLDCSDTDFRKSVGQIYYDSCIQIYNTACNRAYGG